MNSSAGRSANSLGALSQPQVVAYELGISRGTKLTLDDGGLVVGGGTLSEAAKMHRSKASLFILAFDAGAQITTSNRSRSAPMAECDKPTFIAICKSIDLALERGASVCFLILQGTAFQYFSQQDVPSYNRDEHITSEEIESYFSFRDNIIGFRFLQDSNVRMQHTLMYTDITACAGEFHPFTREYCAAEHKFEIGTQEDVTVLATATNEPVAIARDYKRGRLFWWPVRSPMAPGDLLPAITTLVRCTATYRSKQLAEEPAWVREQFAWSGEAAVRDQEAEALATLEKVKPIQEQYSRLRRILWVRDEPLRLGVSDFLQEMGFAVEDNERFQEDFWLLADGKRAAIGEVKGINSNVTPSDLAHLVSHRKSAGLPDEFPSIFVALTFANTESVNKRRIEPNVCRRAKEDNILLLRTIDLVQFYDGIRRGLDGFTVDALWRRLKAGGGWLEVTANDFSVRTD